ncbi:sorting nexin-25 [Pseudorasbora parva]|uniref:sorting nexin-25 n=1 Tax=Pseudorasbora parva TaxID=51549 RepID=UPI00351E2886
MYTWRCFLAIIFVLVYFSEVGQIWTQAFFCILCFLNLPFEKQDREASTQTDTLEETARESKKDRSVGAIDEIDTTGTGQIVSHAGQYPNVKKSLLLVFKSAYTHLVKPWYTAPELDNSQPLYRALETEYNLVVEKIICKAMNIDLSTTSVGCIRIFTNHLHNAKQSDGSPVFSSRSEEMAVLRTFSQALVRNLFPESLWKATLYQCVLTEIVATKALDVLVTCLCNPDNLNQMVVLQLDRVTPKSSIGDLVNSDVEGTTSSVGSEEAGRLTDEAEDGRTEDIKGKKKVNRIKEQISKLVNKVNPKKAYKKKYKNKDQVLLQRALSARRSAVIEDDGASSREGSFKSGLDSDNDSETDVYQTIVQEDMMEFKLSYEMWRVGNWAVHVKNVQKEDEELCFTVHLEERNNPENLHWDVKKTQSDILDFHSLWQDTSTLPSISAILENTKKELDEAYAEEVRSAFEHFLQELVSDAKLGHTQSVFKFLGPFAQLWSDNAYEGGVWSLLNGLASFLTPSQEEEECSNCREEGKLDEAGASTDHAGPTAQPACIDSVEELKGGIMEGPLATNIQFCTPHEETDPLRNRKPDIQDTNQISDPGLGFDVLPESLAESLDIFVNRSKLVIPTVHSSDISSSVVSHGEDLQALSISGDGFKIAQTGGKTNKKEKLTHKKSNGSQKFKVKEKTGQFKDEMTNQPSAQKKEAQSNWEQVEATKAMFDLLKEITGNSVLINIVDAILKPVQPLVKKKINNFLKRMHPTEDQLATYIDTFREKIWPNGNVPQQPPCDSEEKKETKERALQLINSKYSKFLILKKTDVETVFKIFQDTEENKKLVYRLLSYVLREFLPGEPAFCSIANLTVKDCVS